MRAGILLLLSLFATTPTLAGDPPDSQLDPQTGLIHTLDSRTSGSSEVIRHILDPGLGQPTVIEITSGHADHSPHLAIGDASVVEVVWQRELAADEIRAVALRADGTLGAERLLSEAWEDSRNPDIVLCGAVPWVAYEIHGGAGVAVAVQTIVDDPDPIGPRIVVGTTSFSGDADVRIHASHGHLWTTWMDAADDLAYAVFDAATQTWATPAYQEVAEGDVATALKEVEGVVLGQ